MHMACDYIKGKRGSMTLLGIVALSMIMQIHAKQVQYNVYHKVNISQLALNTKHPCHYFCR